MALALLTTRGRLLSVSLALAVGLTVLPNPSPAYAASRGCAPLPPNPSRADVRAVGRPWPGHPDRRLIGYRVVRGDTPALIATHCRAWTRELVRLNRLTRRTLHPGDHLRVPVVLSVLPTRSHTPRHPGLPPEHHPSKARVKAAITAAAKRHGVPRSLALAIAWQESGWQQHVRSRKGAIGAMQVMPGTGRWLSDYTGRTLHIRRLHDNTEAGVLLLKILTRLAPPRQAIAGYYQGLRSVRHRGMYTDTVRYVRSVRALQRAFANGWDPLD